MNQLSTRSFAVVTGASSGIGLELAKQFAQNGFDLLITSESDGILTAATELERLGAQVQTIQADLATYEGVEALYAGIKATGRPLDAIAINAGIGSGGASFAETDLQKELELIQLNVTSAVHLAKYVVRDMAARGQGRILFTSSIAATMPGPFEAVYAASKAFIQSFAQALREELKETGVTVTSLQPGPTETNFFHRAGMDNTKVGQGKKDDAAEVARQGYDALMAGEDHIVAGSVKNKAMAAANKLTPETAKAAMHRRMSEPVDA